MRTAERGRRSGHVSCERVSPASRLLSPPDRLPVQCSPPPPAPPTASPVRLHVQVSTVLYVRCEELLRMRHVRQCLWYAAQRWICCAVWAQPNASNPERRKITPAAVPPCRTQPVRLAAHAAPTCGHRAFNSSAGSRLGASANTPHIQCAHRATFPLSRSCRRNADMAACKDLMQVASISILDVLTLWPRPHAS